MLPGLALFLLLARVDYRIWRKLSWLIYGAGLLLLILVFIPGVGAVINGSNSWLSLGGYTFQPSELAKLAIIIMAAALYPTPSVIWRTGKTVWCRCWLFWPRHFYSFYYSRILARCLF